MFTPNPYSYSSIVTSIEPTVERLLILFYLFSGKLWFSPLIEDKYISVSKVIRSDRLTDIINIDHE